MWVAALNVDIGPRRGVSSPCQGVLVPAEGNCGPCQGEYGSPHRLQSFNISFIIFTVRTGSRLLPVSVIQGPGHSFTNEDPTIFQEDLNTTCARVSRPRQFPSVSLPTSGAPLSSQQVQSEGLSLSDIQQLHNTTGDKATTTATCFHHTYFFIHSIIICIRHPSCVRNWSQNLSHLSEDIQGA